MAGLEGHLLDEVPDLGSARRESSIGSCLVERPVRFSARTCPPPPFGGSGEGFREGKAQSEALLSVLRAYRGFLLSEGAQNRPLRSNRAFWRAVFCSLEHICSLRHGRVCVFCLNRIEGIDIVCFQNRLCIHTPDLLKSVGGFSLSAKQSKGRHRKTERG